MEFHPLANAWSLLEGKEFEEFCADIKAKGLHEPIWTLDNQILDGRNRYRACLETGTDPRFRPYEGNDPIGFVVSLNDKRRHCSPSQRAMVAARIAHFANGGDRRSQDFSRSRDLLNQADAATLMRVSVPSVKRAVTVQKHGIPELGAAVDNGEIEVAPAQTIARLPKEEQKTALDAAKQKASKRDGPKKDRAPSETTTSGSDFMESASYACQSERHTNVLLKDQHTRHDRVILSSDFSLSADKLAQYYDRNEVVQLITAWSKFWPTPLIDDVINLLNRKRTSR